MSMWEAAGAFVVLAAGLMYAATLAVKLMARRGKR